MTGRPNKLVTIGTGAGYAVLGKGGSAHLVQIAEEAFLLDCGEGAAGWLTYLNVLHRIKYIFLSHLHADHTTGLFMVLQNMLLSGRNTSLEVYMPESGMEAFSRMQETVYLGCGGISHDMFDVNYRPITTSILIQTNEYSIRAWLSDHFDGDVEKVAETNRVAYGFTLDTNDRRLVYTGDVSTIDCFKDEIVPGSTLLCEAMHVEPASIIRIALDKKVKQVIFTHVDPTRIDQLEDLCSHSDIAVAARDGLEVAW